MGESELIQSLIKGSSTDTSDYMRSPLPLRLFREYNDEYEFLLSYWREHKKMPEKSTFQRIYPNMRFTVTKERVQFYRDELVSRENYNIMAAAISKCQKFLEKPGFKGITEAMQEMSSLRDEFVMIGATSDIDFSEMGNYPVELYDRSAEIATSSRIMPPYQLLLDNHVMAGWDPQDFITLFGRFGIGKSWITQHFAVQAWMQQRKVLFMTKEMSADMTLKRFQAMIFGLNWNSIQYTILTQSERKQWEDAWNRMQLCLPAKFIISDFSAIDRRMPPADLIYGKIDQYNPHMTFVDSAHLLFGMTEGRSMVEDAYRLSRNMKAIAQQTNHVLCISVQAGRASEGKRKGAGAANVGWSDGFGQDSDYLIEVAGGRSDPDRQMIFHKCRNSAGGKIKVNFKLNPTVDMSAIEIVDTVAISGGARNTKKDEEDDEFDEY